MYKRPHVGAFTMADIVDNMLSYDQQNTFPPYNLISNDDGSKLFIEIAVAGFKLSDLSITAESDMLVVRGRKVAGEQKLKYHHHGIAKRSFELKWRKSSEFEVSGASLDDGMLFIELHKTDRNVNQIMITSGVQKSPEPQLLNG